MNQDLETAFRSLRGNRLRTSLTVAIIAVGIMSLVSIQTAIEIMTDKVVGSFSRMGSSMFTIGPKADSSPISIREASAFARQCDFATSVSVYAPHSFISQIRSGGSVTDPVVETVAADGHYLDLQQSSVSAGRNFSTSDIASGAPVALIGDNVRRKLFGDHSGLGETIVADGRHLTVIGTIERQGAMFGTGLDNSVIIPPGNESDCRVAVCPAEGVEFMEAVLRAESLMRAVRRTRPEKETDFEIVQADTMQSRLASVKRKLTLSALLAGLVTLLGSTVGLMNIMLVSVKERTREIGTRKALGARKTVIIRQFMAESVLIGQAGGLVGIVLGVLSGNLVALLMEGRFTIPWLWILASVLLCLAVSVGSGIIPARRAASLNPVEALRDE